MCSRFHRGLEEEGRMGKLERFPASFFFFFYKCGLVILFEVIKLKCGRCFFVHVQEQNIIRSQT